MKRKHWRHVLGTEVPHDDGQSIDFYKSFQDILVPLLTKQYNTTSKQSMPIAMKSAIISVFPKPNKRAISGPCGNVFKLVMVGRETQNQSYKTALVCKATVPLAWAFKHKSIWVAGNVWRTGHIIQQMNLYSVIMLLSQI